MEAYGLYYLDGLDMWEEYGFFVSSGSETIMAIPKRKEVYSLTRVGNSGSDYFLDNPKYSPKDIRLKGGILASSNADFWTKYNSLKSAFMVPGWINLRCSQLETTTEVIYKGVENVKRLTRLLESNLVCVTFDLVLIGRYDIEAVPIPDNFFLKVNGSLFQAGGNNVFIN